VKLDRNQKTATILASVFVGMIGLSYASVPLYELFCQVTGYGGTTQRADAAPGQVFDREITVQFDANVNNGLAWRFEPVQRAMTVKVGEQHMAYYRATNITNEPVTGQAVFNVTPDLSGLYFNKIQCFCFTEQTLQPGESVEMPVLFFIDPEIMTDDDLYKLTTMTLSYTFYPAANPQAAAPKQGAGENG
jgi:cytochrome c oxidase assembly protein subunit 11